MIVNKFQDEQALISSYKELEKEFTKKCQELARVKQELLDKSEQEDELGNEQQDINEDFEPVPQIVVENENVEPEKEPEKISDVVVEKSVSTQNGQFDIEFRAKVNEFFKNTPEAKEFSKEISKILLADKSLLNCTNPIKVAYLLAKEKRGETPKERVEEKVVAVEDSVNIPNITILSNGVLGSAPRREEKRCKSIFEAGEEVIKRYF